MQSIAGKNNTITVISLFGFGKQHKWNLIIYLNSFKKVYVFDTKVNKNLFYECVLLFI